MTVQQKNVIDFVAHDPSTDFIVLVMVEHRQWGDSGELLADLQEKLNTYFLYAKEGNLVSDFPAMKDKPVKIELRCVSEPGPRELKFLEIVNRQHLGPAGILFEWRVIGEMPNDK